MKPVVLMDVDEVIADFNGCFIKLCNEANGTNFTRNDLVGKTWELGEALNLTKEQNNNTWILINGRGVAQRMELLHGAKNAVQHINSISDLYFVTSPPLTSKTWFYDRYKWLSKHFGSILAKKVVVTKCKHVADGDIFVDDKESNVLSWIESHPTKTGVIWRNYTTDKSSNNIIETNDWEKLISLIENYKI